jgi:hypothetical protein
LVKLVHPQDGHQVSVVALIAKCDLFTNKHRLTIAPYDVQSEVSLQDVQDFVSILVGKTSKINDKNPPGLSQLSDEFGFRALLRKLLGHRRSPGLMDSETAERAAQHKHEPATLQLMLFAGLRRFGTDPKHLVAELEAVRDAQNSARPVPAATPPRTTTKSPRTEVPSVPARLSGRSGGIPDCR